MIVGVSVSIEIKQTLSEVSLFAALHYLTHLFSLFYFIHILFKSG